VTALDKTEIIHMDNMYLLLFLYLIFIIRRQNMQTPISTTYACIFCTIKIKYTKKYFLNNNKLGYCFSRLQDYTALLYT